MVNENIKKLIKVSCAMNIAYADLLEIGGPSYLGDYNFSDDGNTVKYRIYNDSETHLVDVSYADSDTDVVTIAEWIEDDIRQNLTK